MNLYSKKKSYDWLSEIGLEWSIDLDNLKSIDYSNHLNNFIEQIYLSDKEIYPVKNKLFESFKRCSLKDVKVVIIDDKPIEDIRSSGVGRGIIENSSLSNNVPLKLRNFRDCIYETIYGNQYSITSFDNSLYDYCDEGILFLNCSMCVEKDKDYTVVWKHFIRNVIQEINNKHDNIVYVFLTGNNLDFRKYIDENKNKVIINSTDVLMSYSTIFLEIDEYIKDNYPHNFSHITW